jgi:hypothetical protein
VTGSVFENGTDQPKRIQSMIAVPWIVTGILPRMINVARALMRAAFRDVTGTGITVEFLDGIFTLPVFPVAIT